MHVDNVGFKVGYYILSLLDKFFLLFTKEDTLFTFIIIRKVWPKMGSFLDCYLHGVFMVSIDMQIFSKEVDVLKNFLYLWKKYFVWQNFDLSVSRCVCECLSVCLSVLRIVTRLLVLATVVLGNVDTCDINLRNHY